MRRLSLVLLVLVLFGCDQQAPESLRKIWAWDQPSQERTVYVDFEPNFKNGIKKLRVYYVYRPSNINSCVVHLIAIKGYDEATRLLEWESSHAWYVYQPAPDTLDIGPIGWSGPRIPFTPTGVRPLQTAQCQNGPTSLKSAEPIGLLP